MRQRLFLTFHQSNFLAVPICLATVASLLGIGKVSAQELKQKTARVFILAGQSNMVGHGVVDLNDPKDYNGGKGTLLHAIENSKVQKQFSHVRNPDGSWKVRDDVWIRFQTESQLKTGGLTIGFTGYDGEAHHIGPEFQFGHVVGDAFDEPVLLIKTAWGGKSLHADFRPPSSGGDVGPYYVKMLEEIGAGLQNAPHEFPGLKDHQLVVSGFVWQQGWNDMIDEAATAEYESNLLNLIKDIRQQLDCPDLPVVIGELGNGGDENVSENMKAFRAAQASAANHGDRNVAFVTTTQFARPAEESPNVGHLHHWFGNAESYFLVGDALGKRMVRLINEKNKPRVLILGDSISIGYTPVVQQILSNEAIVMRPMTNENQAENCDGTDKGILNIDGWLNIDGGNWDVIHFNFGLHDLKHVSAESGKATNDPNDPLQSGPEEYEKQLQEIVDKLKATKAKLIFCTTTPVPADCKPLRETTSPPIYNAIAGKLAEKNGIEVDDLFEFANSQLEEIQIPANVHFTPEGSQVLGEEVAKVIRRSLLKQD